MEPGTITGVIGAVGITEDEPEPKILTDASDKLIGYDDNSSRRPGTCWRRQSQSHRRPPYMIKSPTHRLRRLHPTV